MILSQITDGSNFNLIIADKETHFLFEGISEALVVTSEIELRATILEKNRITAVIIIAELGWTSKALQHFWGFDVAVSLRQQQRLQVPIVFISTFPQIWFEKLSTTAVKYNILFGRGTVFLHINDFKDKLPELLQNLYPISLAVLTDINEMLLNQSGVVIDQITHSIHPSIDEKRLQQAFDRIAVYMDDSQKAQINWMYFEERLIALGDNAPSFYNVREELLLQCTQLLTKTSVHSGPKFALKRHRILVLEDDTNFACQLQTNLQSYFEEVICITQAVEAIKILDEDRNNTITALLTDWRLYTDARQTYWQMQGYEVLSHAADTHLIGLFSLTSLADRNINHIRNLLGLEVQLYKKNYFINDQNIGQWEMLADAIIQKCDEVVKVMSSQPGGLNWEKYRQQYIVQRNIGWALFERTVTDEATRIFKYYYDAVKADDCRNTYSINEMGLSIKGNLKAVLILRRVYLGLYFNLTSSNQYLQEIRPAKLLGNGENFDTELKHHSIDTHSLLRKDWWDDLAEGLAADRIESEWSKFDQRLKNLRNALCLELAVLPTKGLLPEEKSWLTKNNTDYSFLFHYWP